MTHEDLIDTFARVSPTHFYEPIKHPGCYFPFDEYDALVFGFHAFQFIEQGFELSSRRLGDG